MDMSPRSRRAGAAAEQCGIEIGEEGGRTVCWLSGDVDNVSAPTLRAVLGERLDAAGEAVIDLSGVRFVDSSGVGVLVGALKRFQIAGGRLALRAPAPPIRRVLQMTGLADAFPLE